MLKRIVLPVVVLVAVSLTSCVRLVGQTAEEQGTVTDRVTSVRLRNGSGNVVVRGVEGGSATEVRVTVDYPKGADRPTGRTYRLEGGTLVLDGCGDRCSVDYEVTLPSKDVGVVGESGSGDVELEGVASVEISVGSGNATVRGVSGLVRVEDGSGDVRASDVGGGFTGKVGSGDVALSGMRGAVVVENGSGDVRVEMAAVRSVHADTNSGNVTVRVPPGAYRVDVDGGGDRNVDVENDPRAGAELVLRSGSGDLSLRAA